MSGPKSPVTGSLLTTGCVMPASSCCTFPSQRSSVVAVVKAVARVDCDVVKAVVWGRCGCSGGIMDVGVVWLWVLCGCEFGCGFGCGHDVPVVGAVTLEAGLRQALGVLHPGCTICAAVCWALGNSQDSPRAVPICSEVTVGCLLVLPRSASQSLAGRPPLLFHHFPLAGSCLIETPCLEEGAWCVGAHVCVFVYWYYIVCGVFLWLYGVVGA